MKPNLTAETLMREALSTADYPYAFSLRAAAEALSAKSRKPIPKGARRKLSTAEARAAVICVSDIISRLGLSASAVCKTAFPGTPATQFHRYHLTAAEMLDHSIIPADRRFVQGVEKLAAMVRSASRLATFAGHSADETALLHELGASIPDFLLPFDARPNGEFERLAADIQEMSAFFSKVRAAADETEVDLLDYLGFCDHGQVAYDAATGRMMRVPDDPIYDPTFDNAPSVPLTIRSVASCTVRCRIEDDHPQPREDPLAHKPRRDLGTMPVRVVEVISLGVVRRKGKLRMVLFAEPWTAIYGEPGTFTETFGRSVREYVDGNPLFGERTRRVGCKEMILRMEGDPSFHCDDYMRHCAEIAETDDDLPVDYLEALENTRQIELTAESLERIFGRGFDEQWRLFWHSTNRPAWLNTMALETTVTLPNGLGSNVLKDRLAEALMRNERPLHELLLEKAAERVRAMNGFEEARDSNDVNRRKAYLKLMRS